MKLYISKEKIEARLKELGDQITSDFQHKNLLVVGILKGSVIFLSDLVRAIDLDITIDFLEVSSYGSGKTSSGNVEIIRTLKEIPKGKDVLIIEDILDTGLTLQNVIQQILALQPNSLSVAALLVKKGKANLNYPVSYTGFEIEDKFVVGYGLDFAEKYRNLPEIYILDE